MGSHSMQAVALTVFLLASVVVCAGISGGNAVVIAIGVGALAVAVWLFRKCKAIEEASASS